MKSKKRNQRMIAYVKHHEWQELSRKSRRALTQMFQSAAQAFNQSNKNELTTTH